MAPSVMKHARGIGAAADVWGAGRGETYGMTFQ